MHLAESKQVVYKEGEIEIINYISHLATNDNDNSIVTLLKYKDFTILFTGDIGTECLEELLKDLPRNITVLKVPHHGAKNSLSKEILSVLNPTYSLISVGTNKFGHPNLYTLALLEDRNVLRTDIHNSIKITVLNKNVKGERL